jgi:hypothetical protein
MKYPFLSNYLAFYVTSMICSVSSMLYYIYVLQAPPDSAVGGYSGTITLIAVVQVLYALFSVSSMHLTGRIFNRVPTVTVAIISSLCTAIALALLEFTKLPHLWGIFLWLPIYVLVPSLVTAGKEFILRMQRK